jgi:Xaa-Pro aminopeptidase
MPDTLVPDGSARAIGAGVGTVALGTTPRIDYERLRSDRRRRTLAAMADEEIDVLVLGRESNARFVSGARRLWTSGARPFGPGCIVMADGGRVHLLSTWADGIPFEIPFENLYGLSWNPSNLLASLGAIAGLAEARRIGVDGMTPGAARLFEKIAPRAELIDATALLTTLRRVKTVDELDCIRTAVAVAEGCFVHAVDGVRPGVSGRELAGRFIERLGDYGLSVATGEGTFGAAPTSGVDLRRGLGDRPLGAGDLVVLASGVLFEGYQGDVARTWPCTAAGERPGAIQRELGRRSNAVRDALLGACRAGATAAELVRAYSSTGEVLPSVPVVQGLGLGVEPPVAGGGVPAGAGEAETRLEAGMVLALQGYVAAEGVGGVLAKEVVVVTEGGCERLTRLGAGPLGATGN